jgi:hypothetical protein
MTVQGGQRTYRDWLTGGWIVPIAVVPGFLAVIQIQTFARMCP